MLKKIVSALKNAICKWHLFLIIPGTIAIFMRLVLAWFPKQIEYYYSQNIYPYISQKFLLFHHFIPTSFSGFEIVASFLLPILLICILTWGYWLFLLQKQSFAMFAAKSFWHTLAIGLGVYCLFMFIWGFNYLRMPFSKHLKLNFSKAPTAKEYKTFALDMIAIVNHNKDAKINIKKADTITNQALQETFKKVNTPFWLPPATKFLYNNQLLNMAGISGIFLPLFMEPHVNSSLSQWEHVCVATHEKAHFYGFASETDANLVAYVSCVNSPHKFLRYSAALYLLLYTSLYVPKKEWLLIKEKLCQRAKKDLEQRKKRQKFFYQRYKLLQILSRKINDAYLKANAQKLGVKTYKAVLPQFLRWWQKKKENLANAKGK